MQKDTVKSFIDQLEAKKGRQLKVRNAYDIEAFAKTLFNMEAVVDDDEFAYYAEKSKELDFKMPDTIARYLYFHSPDPRPWLEDIYVFAKFLGIEDPEHDAEPETPKYHMDVRIINGKLAIEWWELPENW